MKRFITLFLIISILFGCAEEDDSVEIEFIVKTDSLSAGEKVFLVGNKRELGAWNPGLIQLEKSRENRLTKKILFHKNDTLLFKFTKGLWQNEALNADSSIPDNHRIIATNDTIFEIEINNWKEGASGQITGQVQYLKNLTYKDLLPRDVIVWLPPNYDQLEDQYFPVLYMHDGQNIFDPKTSFMNMEWRIDEIADSLIRNYEIEPVIVVGIYSTKNRSAEYLHTEEGKTYMEFIIQKLKPLIDTKFRTKPDKQNTATGGSSLGGLIAFMLAWEYDDVFEGAACLSPAFKINEIDYVTRVITTNQKKRPLKIYIDNGGVGLEKRLQPGIEEMASALKERGFREDHNLFLYFDEKGEHKESAWAKRFWRPLKIFFGRNGVAK